MNPSWVGELETYLRGQLRSWNLPERQEWKVLLFNNSHPQISNVDLFWFADSAQFPAVVTKLCRDPQPLQHEYDNLQRVHPAAGRATPRPLALEPHRDFTALWMQGVPGYSVLARDYEASHLSIVTNTIIELHSQLRTSSSDSDRYLHAVARPLESLSSFGTAAKVARGCVDLRSRISETWLAALPSIPQHGDFVPSNVLWDNGDIRILDWENFAAIDLPAFDLFTFITALRFFSLSAEFPIVRRIQPELIRSLLHQYATGLALPFNDLELLLPLMLINWFHLHWSQSRRQFAERMYTVIEQYFHSPANWQKHFGL